jgi:precorrin-4/cobalt-precorrin-4 C11-methyltransferase
MVIRGTLSDISEKAAKTGITKTALILVGRTLGNGQEVSRLYDSSFSHEFREAEEE